MNDIEFQIVPALPQVDTENGITFCFDYVLAAEGDLSHLNNVELWLEENIGYIDEVYYTISFEYLSGIERLYVTVKEKYWDKTEENFWHCYFDKTDMGWQFQGYHTNLGIASAIVEAVRDIHTTMTREPAGASL